MSEQPKNQPTFNIGQVLGNINTGDIDIKGDQIGTQYNYADPEVQAASIELKSLLLELQTKNPAVTTTAEALAVIDVEFTEINQTNNPKLAKFLRFLLEPKRHVKALKATAAEVAKHYLEESVWSKAIITYIDTLID